MCEVCWEMTYQDGHKEMIFESELALAELLNEEQVFLNNHWWEEDWTEKQKDLFSLNVICNDVFAWACADSVEMFYEDIEDVWAYYKKDPLWGTAVWCMKKRNEMPQQPVYEDIMKRGIWDLDKMKLGQNTINEYVQGLFSQLK